MSWELCVARVVVATSRGVAELSGDPFLSAKIPLTDKRC